MFDHKLAQVTHQDYINRSEGRRRQQNADHKSSIVTSIQGFFSKKWTSKSNSVSEPRGSYRVSNLRKAA